MPLNVAVALIGGLAMLGSAPAFAQDASVGSNSSATAAPLPTLARCEPGAAPPVLPKLWRAVALMLPYGHAQLDVGEFVYDGNLPALRVSVTGTDSGAIDLLITPEQTYQLSGPREAPNACATLGRLFNLPGERWLSSQARCVGRGPIGSTQLEWWKMPSNADAEPSATWFWYRTGSRLPWRAMFTALAPDPPVIGEYSLSYFPTFEAIPRSNLAALRDLCRARAAPASPRSGATTVRALMRGASDIAEAERTRRVETLIPGLSKRACVGMRPYDWPRRFNLTAIMTPTAFNHGPYPADVYFDWDAGKTLLTRMHDLANPRSGETVEALLVADHDGYDIRRPANGAPSCSQPYPGVVRPDWMRHAKCQCRGVVTNNAAFGTKDTLQLLSCPLDHDSTFWAIYRNNGAPFTLRSTALNPGGLTLADYYHWRPGATVAPERLRVPEQCTGAAAMFTRPNFFERAGARGGFAERCSGCHLVGN
jgi:hypothetical protein